MCAPLSCAGSRGIAVTDDFGVHASWVRRSGQAAEREDRTWHRACADPYRGELDQKADLSRAAREAAEECARDGLRLSIYELQRRSLAMRSTQGSICGAFRAPSGRSRSSRAASAVCRWSCLPIVRLSKAENSSHYGQRPTETLRCLRCCCRSAFRSRCPAFLGSRCNCFATRPSSRGFCRSPENWSRTH